MSNETIPQVTRDERSLPLSARLPEWLFTAVHEAVGTASMCWNPRPGNQVFSSEEASAVAFNLCQKIADALDRVKGELPPGSITVSPSPTADTRTCDFANVPRALLLESSQRHIADVGRGLAFFAGLLVQAAAKHDDDKLTEIDWFHRDFASGFATTGWWDNHRRITRHHIDKPDGVREDVNLIDVLEHIVDCVMAGMARSGSVYTLQLPAELLERAFQNTVALLKSKVAVAPAAGREGKRIAVEVAADRSIGLSELTLTLPEGVTDDDLADAAEALLRRMDPESRRLRGL